MFQAERAREDSRASPAAVFAFTTNSFSPRLEIVETVRDVARKRWGDLPDSNHARAASPLDTRVVEWAYKR
jgi:hypothetical protein